jgi:D-psicose/D-tagatose/L-ribulose 3-epimerase
MHLHLGDNNREVPGKGCRDWRTIFQALSDIDFSGAVSFEPLPHRMTPEEIGMGMLDPNELQKEMMVSIQMLKSIMEGIS